MPIGQPYNGAQSPLEAAAITARGTLIPFNFYNNAASANEYTATHSRAMSDIASPVWGKGSGIFLDIENYSAVGGEYDRNGFQTNNNSLGSGRNLAFGLNGGDWGYGPIPVIGMQNYVHPDTSINVTSGQVII